MATVAELSIEIAADTKAAEAALARIRKRLEDSGQAAGPVEQKLSAMERSVSAGVKRLAENYEKMGDSAAEAMAKAQGQRGAIQANVMQQAKADVDKLTTSQSGLSKELGVTREDLLRGGLAAVGFGAGLSIASSAGDALHDSMARSIELAIEEARTSRAVAMAYGTQASAYTQFAQQLSAQTGFTKTSILEASLSARTLNQNYGLTIAQTQKLISVSADLAAMRGIGVAEAFERIQSAMRGEAEASEYLGLTLNETFLKTKGLTEGMSESEKTQIRYTEALKQTAQFSGLAAQANAGAEGSFRRLNTAQIDLGTTIGKLLLPVAAKGAEALTEMAKGAEGLAKNLGSGIEGGVTALDGFIKKLNEIPPWARPILAGAGPVGAAVAGGGGGASGAELLGAAATGVVSGVANTVLPGSGPAISAAVAEAEKVAEARQRTLDAAKRTAEARERGQGSMASESPEATAQREAKAASDYAKVWTDALRARTQATLDVIDAQTRLFEMSQEGARLDIRAQQRAIEEQSVGPRAAIATIDNQIADAQRSRLDLTKREAQLTLEMLGPQRAMADLQDRMGEAQQKSVSLELEAARIRAQQAALPSSRRLEDLGYEQQRLTLQIAAERQARRQGGTLGVDISGNRRALRGLARSRPGAELEALEAGRPVTMANRAIEDQGLAVAGRTNALQQEGLGIQATIDAIKKKQDAVRDEGAAHAARTAIIVADLTAERRAQEDNLKVLDNQKTALDLAASALDRQAAAYADMLAPARLKAMAELTDYQERIARALGNGTNAVGTGAGLANSKEGRGPGGDAEYRNYLASLGSGANGGTSNPTNINLAPTINVTGQDKADYLAAMSQMWDEAVAKADGQAAPTLPGNIG